MKVKIYIEIYLHDGKTDWIGQAIEEQLDAGEAILDYVVTEEEV